jgi:hypothetical protein
VPWYQVQNYHLVEKKRKWNTCKLQDLCSWSGRFCMSQDGSNFHWRFACVTDGDSGWRVCLGLKLNEDRPEVPRSDNMQPSKYWCYIRWCRLGLKSRVLPLMQ